MKSATASGEVRDSVAAVRADIERSGNAHDLAGEIREYFARLSPDFDVTVRGFTLGSPDERVRRRLGPAKTFLLRVGDRTDAFAENLEAVVRLRARTNWVAKPPAFA